MEWAAGVNDARPPAWVNRLTFAKQFGIAPAEVGKTPAIWYHRWLAWERALNQRRAREAVDRYGLEKVTPEAREIYNALILGLRDATYHD